MNKILKTFAACFIGLLPVATFAKTSEAEQVRKIIDKLKTSQKYVLSGTTQPITPATWKLTS